MERRAFRHPLEVGLVPVHAAPVTSSTVAVAIDLGKNEFMVSVTNASRVQLLKPLLGCRMTRRTCMR